MARLAFPLGANLCPFVMLLACNVPEAQVPAVFPEQAATGSSCEQAAHADPLVTEWPASEKAHLESVLAEHPVAVRYEGCELHIIDACQLSGTYSWTPTPIAEDTLQFDTREDLATKLPLGGFRLESALERHGSLRMVMTVSGSFELDQPELEAPDLGPCTEATHLIAAMSVGSFRLVGGGKSKASTDVGVSGAGVTARRLRSERLLKEAGVADACETTTTDGPALQCSSPIRLRLRALRRALPTSRLERARRTGEVLVHIPLVAGSQTAWTLHDDGGAAICPLPCTQWMRPDRAYTLRASDSFVGEPEIIPIRGGFPVAPGGKAIGIYRPERGSPDLSSIAFWSVGAPSLVIGGAYLVGGLISSLNQSPSSNQRETEYGLLGTGLAFAAVGGGLWWWYSFSEEASFEAQPVPATESPAAGSAGVGVGPGRIVGSF